MSAGPPAFRPFHAASLEHLESRTLLSVAVGVGSSGPPAVKTTAIVAQQITNAPPVPVITVDSRFVPLNTPVTFSAQNTTDPENDLLTFTWRFNDGTDPQTGVIVQHTFTQAGFFPVVLTVRDTSGNVARGRLRMVAGFQRPVPEITSPTADSTFRAGQQITAFGTATDAQDAFLPDRAFTWRARLVRGNASRLLARAIGERNFTFDVPERILPSPNQFIRITLTVRNSLGLASSTSVNLPTQTAELILNSNFEGIRLGVNGNLVTTPQTLLSAVGGVYTVSAPRIQDLGTFTADFRQWSDGGKRTHRIRIGEGGQTLFAIYDIGSSTAGASVAAAPARAMFSTQPIAPADPLADVLA